MRYPLVEQCRLYVLEKVSLSISRPPATPLRSSRSTQPQSHSPLLTDFHVISMSFTTKEDQPLTPWNSRVWLKRGLRGRNWHGSLLYLTIKRSNDFDICYPQHRFINPSLVDLSTLSNIFSISPPTLSCIDANGYICNQETGIQFSVDSNFMETLAQLGLDTQQQVKICHIPIPSMTYKRGRTEKAIKIFFVLFVLSFFSVFRM